MEVFKLPNSVYIQSNISKVLLLEDAVALLKAYDSTRLH